MHGMGSLTIWQTVRRAVWQPSSVAVWQLYSLAGSVATVQPGIDDVHRIGNKGPTEAITIHIYGRDLLARPGSINITFN